MKDYIFDSCYFTSQEAMMDFVNNRNFVKKVISVIPDGAHGYTLFYLW